MKKTYSLGQRLVAQTLLGSVLLQSCFNPSVPIAPLEVHKPQETSADHTSQELILRLRPSLKLDSDVESNVLPIDKQGGRPNSSEGLKNDCISSRPANQPDSIHPKKLVKTWNSPFVHQPSPKNEKKIGQGSSTNNLNSPSSNLVEQPRKKGDLLATNQPVQENTPKRRHTGLAGLPANQTCINVEETPSYAAQGGYQVKFIKKEQGWVAFVQDKFLNGLQRSFYLPVYEQNISIQDLSKHTPLWIKHHIDVCPPEKDKKCGKGYVYIGSQGLLGGGLRHSRYGQDNMGEYVVKQPIHIAAQKGEIEEIKSLIIRSNPNEGINIVNLSDSNLNTPLHYASSHHKKEAVCLLLSKGAKIDLQDNRGNTALHYALLSLPIIQTLLQAGANPNIQNNEGFTPFYQAVIFLRSKEAIQIFLEKGAKTDIQDKEGNIALHLASEEDTVSLLITYGANKEAKNNAGKTPLFIAVENKNLKKIKLLIEKGAKKEAKDDADNTLLHEVIFNFLKELGKIKDYFDDKEKSTQKALQDAIEVIKLLREKGVNPCLKNKQGKTPVHLALESNDILLAKQLFHALEVESCKDLEGYTLLHRAVLDKDISFLKQLAELGVNKNLKDAQGNTPLHLAVEQGDLNMIEQLMKLGAEVHIANNKGLYSVHLAIVKGKTAIARTLIKHTHINVTDNKESNTPLHWAVDTDNLELIKEFAQAGANLHYINKDGCTPIDLASLRKHPEYVQTIFDVVSSQLNTLGNDGLGHLHRAIKRKDSFLAKQVLAIQGVDIHLKDKSGQTPLHTAVAQADLLIMKLLVSAGAKNDSKDQQGNTPIQLALQNTNPVLVKQLLGILNVDIHAKNPDGSNLLYHMVMNNDLVSAKQLISMGVDKNTKGPYGRSLLYIAAEKGHIDMVKYLVEIGINLEEKDDLYGNTPLHQAAASGKGEVIELLIKAGSQQEATNKAGQTPLHQAAYHNQETAFKLFVKLKANQKSKTEAQDTLLHQAASGGNVNIINECLALGAALEAKNKTGETPLHKAAYHGQEAACKLLLEKGADPTVKNESQTTLLHQAAYGGNEKIVERLLELGADKEAKDKAGETPLHKAAHRGKQSVVRLLIEKGAFIEAKNELEETPLHRAAHWSDAPTVKLLVEKEANKEARNKAGETPLYQAAGWNFGKETIQFLIGVEANKEAKNNQGRTALHQAAYLGNEDIVKLLIELGANKEATDEEENTPLHQAAAQGKLGALNLLMSAGANKEAKNKSGQTPLQVAVANKRTEIAKHLTSLGVNRDTPDAQGNMLLHLAVIAKDPAMVGELVKLKVNVDDRNKAGDSPLMLAILHKLPEIAHQLLEAGASQNQQDQLKNTLVHTAISQGQLSIVKDLVARGADLQAKNQAGLTPIDLTSISNHLDYVAAIFSTKGVDINQIARNGMTHLHRAVERGDEKLVQQLIACQADAAIKDHQGRTSLHYTAIKGNTALLQHLQVGLNASKSWLSLFSKQGSPIDIPDEQGNTPLHLAMGQGHLAVTQLLLQAKADLYAKNKEGLTPIHQALTAKQAYKKIIEPLISQAKQDQRSVSNLLQEIAVQLPVSGGYDLAKPAISQIGKKYQWLVSKLSLLGNMGLIEELEAAHKQIKECYQQAIQWVFNKAVEGKQENSVLPILRTRLATQFDQGAYDKACHTLELAEKLGYVPEIEEQVKAEEAARKGKEAQEQAHQKQAVETVNPSTTIHAEQGNGLLKQIKIPALIEQSRYSATDTLNRDQDLHFPSISMIDQEIEEKVKQDLKQQEDNLRNLQALAFKQHGLLKAILSIPGSSPLHVAAAHHDIPLIKQLLDIDIGIDTVDSTGKTILYVAFEKKNSNFTKQLIELGAKVNAQDSQGRTMLHHAIAQEDILVTTALLDAKADIHTSDKEGLTPLHIAAEYNQTDIAKRLINQHAGVNVKDKQGRTSLHLAAYQGHDAMGELLIEAGADLEAIDEQGFTPLEVALQQGALGLVGLISDAQEDQLRTWRHKTNQQIEKTRHQGKKNIEASSKVAVNWIEDYIVQLPQKEQSTFKASIVPLIEKKLLQATLEEQLSLINYWENGGSFYPAVLETHAVSDWIGESLIIDISQAALISQDEVLFAKLQAHITKMAQDYTGEELERLLLTIREKQLTYELGLTAILEILTYIAPFKAEQALYFLEVDDPYWLASLRLAWLEEQIKPLTHFTISQRKQLSYAGSLLLSNPALIERLVAALRAEKDFNQIKRFVAFISQHKVSENALLAAFYKIPLEATASRVQAWQHYIACELLKGKLVKLSPTHATKLENQAYLLLERGVAYEDLVNTLDTLSGKQGEVISVQLLVDAWELLTAYGASVAICQEALQIIKTRPTHEWEKEVHALVIRATFGAAHERTVEEITTYVAKKSPEAHFISDPEALRKSYEAVLTAYENNSQLFPANKTHIACWKESDIAAWSKHLKGSKLLQAMSPTTQHEVVAVVKRAAELHHGHAPRATQLLALLLYLNHAPGKGRLGQINTGEGKSLIVAMLAATFALQGKKVDVVTTSTELSRPEVEKQQGFFQLLGLSVGENSRQDTKAEAYKQDIVYGTASNFQGDILRSEFLGKDIRGKRDFGVVIVDEVDSMLFDSRRASVRIAGQTPAMHHLELLLGSVYSQVHRMKDHIIEQEGETYYIHEDFQIQEGQITTFSGDPLHMEPVKDKKAYIIGLTKKYVERLLRTLSSEEAREWKDYQRLQEAIISKGIEISQTEDETTREQLEKECQILQDQLKNTEWVKKDRFPVVEVPTHLRDFALQQITNWIESAIQAIYSFKRELHYDVQAGRIIPIDYANTGVLQANMVWSNGLAQMLQIKEGLPVEPEGIATNFLSVPAYFERYGHSIYGLTGTLGNEATKQFLKEVYQADQFILPPYQLLPIAGNEHSSYVCKELPAIVVPTPTAWYEAIVKTNLQHAKSNRAVLIICKYIDQVKQVAQLLKEQYNEHKVLTYTGQENFTKKHIEAGEIIVATNIAGRGTDITTLPEVEANGGLHVCITFLPESYRVELQNAGRTARQGKRGTAQLIVQANKSIEILKSDRDAQEEQAITRAKNDVKNMLFKDRMFSRFCSLESDLLPTHQENAQENIYLLLKKHISVSKQEDQAVQRLLSKKGSLAKEYNWGEEEREGLEERWGIWLHHGLEDQKNTLERAIEENFDTFATTIRQDANKNSLIKNPYYYVKKGNKLLRYYRLDDAIVAYNKAIDLDELHSVNARYNKALALLRYQKNKDHLADAKYNLERAKILLATHHKPQVIGFHATVSQTGNKPQLLDNIQHQIDILIKQESYIDAALKEIAKAQKEDWDIQVTELKTLQDVFQEDTTGANREAAFEKATINGLSHMFVLKAKQPYPWKSIIALACLGIAQVAVGVLAFVYSGGTTGLGLINEGVSDLIAGVKAGISGTFSWAQWGIQKAISIAVSLVASGIKSIKDTISQGAKVVEGTVRDGIKDALKHTAVALGKGVAKELTTAALSHVSEKVIIENLEGWIENEVTKKLETLFSQNELIKKALSIDVANKSNHWQQILISEGMAILTKTDGKFMKFLKGTACGLIRQGVSEIGNHISSQGGSGQAFQLMFQGTTMLHALTEILSMTEDFASEWANEIALKYGKEIDKTFEKGEQKQKKEQAKEAKAPEEKKKDDLILSATAIPVLDGSIEAIQISKNTTYTSKPAETGNKARDYYYGGASSQQDLSKTFARSIQGKLTSKVQADLIQPVTSGIASWGVEKVSKGLTDDVNKALEGFRTQNRTHHLGKQFTKAEKDEKQEGQATLNRESQQKIQDIAEGKLSTIADVPLLSRAIKRPIVIYKNGKVFDTIGSEFPGEPLHICHTPEGVGHWAPYDTSIKVEASGDNNCLHDTLVALLDNKVSAAELRNLEVKEITDNPLLANQLMKEAAKLSILKPTAMMQGGREYRVNRAGILDPKTDIYKFKEGHSITHVGEKGGEETDYFYIGDTNEKGEFKEDESLRIDGVARGEGQIHSFRIMQDQYKKGVGSSFIALDKEGKEVKGYVVENYNTLAPVGKYNLILSKARQGVGKLTYPDNYVFYNPKLDAFDYRGLTIHGGNFWHNSTGCLLPVTNLCIATEKVFDPELITPRNTGTLSGDKSKPKREELENNIIKPSGEINPLVEWNIHDVRKKEESTNKKDG